MQALSENRPQTELAKIEDEISRQEAAMKTLESNQDRDYNQLLMDNRKEESELQAKLGLSFSRFWCTFCYSWCLALCSPF